MIPFFELLRFTLHEKDSHIAQNAIVFPLVWQWAVYEDSGRKRILQGTLLNNHRLQAEEPSLGFDSDMTTKERKQNEHHQTTNQVLQPMGAVLFPWETLYEFGRMICLGFMVTFGDTSSAGTARSRQTNSNEHVGRYSILSKALSLGRRHERKVTKETEFSLNSVKQQNLAGRMGRVLVAKTRLERGLRQS